MSEIIQMDQLVIWLSSALAVGGALAAVLTSDVRSAGLAIWVSGLATGSLFLALGSELTGVVQWIASTLIALGFVLYSVAFGVDDRRPELLKVFLGILVGAAFAGCLWYGLRDTHLVVDLNYEPKKLTQFGQTLFDRYALVLELVALMFLLVSVGVGVLARPMMEDE